MRVLNISAVALWGSLVFVAGCADQPERVIVDPPDAAPVRPSVTRIEAGPDAPKRAQAALINAKEGAVIELGEGKPFQLYRCHALETTTDTVRRYYPQWYRGAA